VKSIEQFAADVFRILKKMDDEANTIVNGVRAGLCDYAAHVGIKTKRYEVPLYRGLVKHLCALGYDAMADQGYGTGQVCDVTVRLPEAGLVWVEVKEAWKEWFSSATRGIKTGEKSYYSYLNRKAGELGKKVYSAAEDFRKLEQLGPPLADYAVFLLVGFDAAARRMDPEVHGLVEQNRLRERGWNLVGPNTWPDSNCPSCRRVMWLFWRKATAPA
jgi:hypothetical protein